MTIFSWYYQHGCGTVTDVEMDGRVVGRSPDKTWIEFSCQGCGATIHTNSLSPQLVS